MFAYEDREVPGKEEGWTFYQAEVGRRGGGRLKAAGTGAYRCNDFCGAWHAVTIVPADVCPPGTLRVILKAQTYCLRPKGSLPRDKYQPQLVDTLPEAR